MTLAVTYGPDGAHMPVTTAPSGPVTFGATATDREHGPFLFSFDDSDPGYPLSNLLADVSKAFGEETDLPAYEKVTAKIQQFGGVSIAPGHDASFTVMLPPGSYYLVDQDVEAPAEADLTTIEVTGPAGDADLSAPSTITMRDFAFDMPAELPAKGSVLIENTGDQPHYAVLIGLKPGTTLDQVNEVFTSEQGTGPDSPMTGDSANTGTQSPDTKMIYAYDLVPGLYAVACFEPNPDRGGAPHIADGMLTLVTLT